MSELQGWFIVGFLSGFLFGIGFYMVKDVIFQFIEIHRLKKQIEKIS